MTIQYTYSPVELCRLLELPKSTLLRWEREGQLERRVGREFSGTRYQRIYTPEDVRAVVHLQLDHFRRQYEQALEAQDTEALETLQQKIAMRKFLMGEIEGLRQLGEMPNLPSKAIRVLLQIAMEQYEPFDLTFHEIIEVVERQSARLVKDHARDKGKMPADEHSHEETA